MGVNRTSDDSDQLDRDRRRMLALLGVWGAGACMTLALVRPTQVLAASGDDDDGGDDDGGDDDDGHGDDNGGDGGHGEGDVRGPSVPPEAPIQERRRGSRKAQRERRWRWLTARRERCADPQQLLLRIRTCSQGR